MTIYGFLNQHVCVCVYVCVCRQRERNRQKHQWMVTLLNYWFVLYSCSSLFKPQISHLSCHTIVPLFAFGLTLYIALSNFVFQELGTEAEIQKVF